MATSVEENKLFLDISELSRSRPLNEESVEELEKFILKSNVPYPIEVEFSSHIVEGISQKLRFNTLDHVKRYFSAIDRTDYEKFDDEDTITTVWDLVEVSVREHKETEGGCNKNSKTKWSYNKKINGQLVELYNPHIGNNDCAFEALKWFIPSLKDNIEIRRELNIPIKKKITTDQVVQIYEKYSKSGKELKIIDNTFTAHIDVDKFNFIFISSGHYKAVINNKYVSETYKKYTKKGYMAFDFETRVDSNNYLKDSICSVVYKPNRTKEKKKRIFTTDSVSSSARKFVEFLIHEAICKRYYHINAFNGSRFDFYLIYGVLNDDELKASDIQIRGYSILSFKLTNHSFSDLSNFLTKSLAANCASYKVKDSKITETKYGSSEKLCFYKEHLGFDEFMNLEATEPDYWETYTEYCIRDSLALFELWQIFRETTNKIVEKDMKIFTQSVEFSPTIGSFSKKVFKKTLTKKQVKYFENFFSYKGKINNEKVNFVRKAIRGGISYSTKCGRVNDTVLVDITSQYPAAMMEMMVPIGYSNWGDEYEPNKHGVYHITDVVFKNADFKPVAVKREKESLDWNATHAEELYLGSQMLKYCLDNGIITKYKVNKSLLTDRYFKGSSFFGNYVNAFFAEKSRQDTLKGTDEYNPACREVCKLFLNSLSGKLVENPAKYKTLEFAEKGIRNLNGNAINYTDNKTQNPLVLMGICMYDSSKINLFKTVNIVGAKNILNCETDSLFFHKKFLPMIENQPFFGNELGQINVEDYGDESYFIAKKCYSLNKEKFAMKGIPNKYITLETYEKLADGEDVRFDYSSIDKNLWGDKVHLKSSNKHRTVKGLKKN